MSAANLRKRRGVAKASITRLDTRLKALEGATDQPTTHDSARQLSSKLKEYEAEFKTAHLSLIDLIDDEGALAGEQSALDAHEDLVASLAVRIEALITHASPPATTKIDENKVLSRRLKRLQECLSAADKAISTLTSEERDSCQRKQHDEQLCDYKRELSDVSLKLMSLDLDESNELLRQHSHLEELVFTCSLQIKELTHSPTSSICTSAPAPTETKGVKLPKLDVPVFNGNILNWRNFWEQFSVSVHNRPSLSDSEKLVYLQQALKGGSARGTIEGLSRSGDNYKEAIECLKAHYDRPRLIHQTHVKAVLEAVPLKDGTGRELRKLHDTVQQHLRALKSMGYEPSGPFITSTLELKLDQSTMFEWQKHSQKSPGVPHYQDLLDFLNLRAQASESSLTDHSSRRPKHDTSNVKKVSTNGGFIASFAANSKPSSSQCILCKLEKHPLYACSQFRNMSHDEKVSTLKSNRLCMNCLGPNHFVKQCKSLHRCKQCQKPHHTLLHVESTQGVSSTPAAVTPKDGIISSNTAIGLKSNSLLMTCRVLVSAPDGTLVEARALLDNASSASFISERLAQSLCLPRASQNARISGIAGLSHRSPLQSLATFSISPVKPSTKKVNVTAVVVPQVTCDLPFHPIPFKTEWNHLSNLQLADPGFGRPGRIDILLGVDVFVDVLLHGRRAGLPGSPVAFETHFGWVLAGNTDVCAPTTHVATYHVSCVTGDDILRQFWEVEDKPLSESSLTPEERSVVQHFKANHRRTESGRFIVPLPKGENTKTFGESRSLVVRRFLSIERTLHAKNQFDEFNEVMKEYFDLGHAELVPPGDLNKSTQDVYYLPMHAVRKESSTTTKIRAVFDASMKSMSGVSLNDVLMVGPTVHPPLVDVLLRFRTHRIAIVADISKMYRAIELPLSDRDLHRFVWRASPSEPLQDYRMTRITFGVSSSSFVANMCVKQNAIDFAHKYPTAAKVVEESFYVDDCLTGADTVEEGIVLQDQLRNLFSEADFLLRKWNSSNPAILQAIPPELRDTQTSLTISNSEEAYTKTGVEWHSVLDHFRLSVANHSPIGDPTKRALVSDIARIYDVLGWYAPTIIKVKILLQRVWESKIDWDDTVPQSIADEWLLWRSQLKSLARRHIPRCYFPKGVHVVSTQLHGFSDASESAYAGVVYLRMVDRDGDVHISLVASKTKVAPLKRLTIPRLELCGAQLLAKLLEHVRLTLEIPLEEVYAWTDSTIVLNWLDGNPRHFKTYVGNRVSFIMDRLPPSRWNHVSGEQNPAAQCT